MLVFLADWISKSTHTLRHSDSFPCYEIQAPIILIVPKKILGNLIQIITYLFRDPHGLHSIGCSVEIDLTNTNLPARLRSLAFQALNLPFSFSIKKWKSSFLVLPWIRRKPRYFPRSIQKFIEAIK